MDDQRNRWSLSLAARLWCDRCTFSFDRHAATAHGQHPLFLGRLSFDASHGDNASIRSVNERRGGAVRGPLENIAVIPERIEEKIATDRLNLNSDLTNIARRDESRLLGGHRECKEQQNRRGTRDGHESP